MDSYNPVTVANTYTFSTICTYLCRYPDSTKTQALPSMKRVWKLSVIFSQFILNIFIVMQRNVVNEDRLDLWCKHFKLNGNIEKKIHSHFSHFIRIHFEVTHYRAAISPIISNGPLRHFYVFLQSITAKTGFIQQYYIKILLLFEIFCWK